jgi:FkbM family methyltransferase
MLIPQGEVIQLLGNIKVNGVFHIGAHECEEMDFYKNLELDPKDIIWVDAINEKVNQAINRGIPNVYNAIITDKDDSEVTFNVSNNVQSSSVLELMTHSIEHPEVVYVSKFTSRSITVDSFFKKYNLDPSLYNFWNFDIQGAELLALKGASESLKFAKALYLEVNERELYKNCGLMSEIDTFLIPLGFKRVKTLMTQWGWGDALYIRFNLI